MAKKIKNYHILIVCPGSNLLKYQDDIKSFIKENNVVTVGINRINSILIPDYHLWMDAKVYRKWGREINKKSTIVFGNHFKKNDIKKYWKGDYEVIKYSKQKWSKYNNDLTSSKYGINNPIYDKKRNKFCGVFRTAGSLAILWSYVKKAKTIKVVGMDGYSYHSNKELLEGIEGQHCYFKGYTDKLAAAWKYRKLKDDKFYKHTLKKDKVVYETLKLIKKYGVDFQIITPTVYNDFYNGDILNIR